MKAGTRTHTSDVTRTNSSGPNLGNRSGARSMALRMASKSIALLRMRGILAARAVAAIIPSNRQRANRSCRDSMSWWDRRGGEGGSGSNAVISPATTAVALSSIAMRPRFVR